MNCKISLLTITALAITVFYSSTVEADYITMDASQLDASKVLYGPGLTTTGYIISEIPAVSPDDPADSIVLGPTFTDTQTPMSGVAGATGSWSLSGQGASVGVYFGLVGSEITTEYGSNDFTGSDTFTVKAFNDNDDLWSYSLFIEDKNGTFIESSLIQLDTGESAVLSLDLTGLDLSEVLSIGVAVHGMLMNANVNPDYPSPGDAHHTSWQEIPEPASIALMGLGSLLAGFGVRRRNRKKAAEELVS